MFMSNDKHSQNNVIMRDIFKRVKKAFLLQWTIMDSTVNKDREN